jgi:hypothetical protein
MNYEGKKPATWAPIPRAPPAIGDVVPRVAASNSAGIRAALATDGVVICTAAATTAEVDTAKGLFWDYLEATGLGIRRTDPDSIGADAWNQVCFPKNGTMSKGGVGQSDFMWHCRLLPGVRSCFAAAWGVDELVTSFDGCGANRNPWCSSTTADGVADNSWVTEGGWFHLDQSWFSSPGLVSYAKRQLLSVFLRISLGFSTRAATPTYLPGGVQIPPPHTFQTAYKLHPHQPAHAQPPHCSFARGLCQCVHSTVYLE